jgi:excisionase family DNA binding protein
MNDDKIVLKTKDVAELLGVPVSTINTWSSERIIPFHRIGGRVFYNRTEIMNLVGGDAGIKQEQDPVLRWLTEQMLKRRQELDKKQNGIFPECTTTTREK